MWQPAPLPQFRNRAVGGPATTGEVNQRPINAPKVHKPISIQPGREGKIALPRTTRYALRELRMAPDELIIAYFSPENVNKIQTAIRARVYRKTEQQIAVDQQPEDQVLNRMTYFYREYVQYTFGSPQQRMLQINEKVVERVSEEVLVNVYAYLTNLSTLDEQKARANNLMDLPKKVDFTARDVQPRPLLP